MKKKLFTLMTLALTATLEVNAEEKTASFSLVEFEAGNPVTITSTDNEDVELVIGRSGSSNVSAADKDRGLRVQKDRYFKIIVPVGTYITKVEFTSNSNGNEYESSVGEFTITGEEEVWNLGAKTTSYVWTNKNENLSNPITFTNTYEGNPDGSTGMYCSAVKVYYDNIPADDPSVPAIAAIIDFPNKKVGIIATGTATTNEQVAIHGNKDKVDGIKFANAYSDGANHVELSVAGGFKKGDKVGIAGVFNNTNDSKNASVTLFTLDGGNATNLFTTQTFINGRTSSDDPTVEEYTLTEDAETRCLARTSGLSDVTTAWVTLLTITRENAFSVAIKAEEGYSTFSSVRNLDFTGTGVTAYTAKVNEAGTAVTLTEVPNNVVPANNAVVLKAETNGTYYANEVKEVSSELTDNDLKISTGEETIDGTIYVLSKVDDGEVGFYKFAGTALTVGKGYLKVDADKAARGFFGFGDDNTTGIQNIKVGTEDNIYYDLQGRRALYPTKGLYIVNGKKIIIK